MSAISLSDDQLAAVDRAAAVLQAPDRGPFLSTVCDRLRGQTALGEGLLQRVLAEAQAEFLRSRPLIADNPRLPKYGFTRRDALIDAVLVRSPAAWPDGPGTASVTAARVSGLLPANTERTGCARRPVRLLLLRWRAGSVDCGSVLPGRGTCPRNARRSTRPDFGHAHRVDPAARGARRICSPSLPPSRQAAAGIQPGNRVRVIGGP